jgi:ribosomal protein S18 acetylase RimI-like enzyme
MTITYRTLQPDEEDTLIDLRVDVFGVEHEGARERFHNYGDDAQRFVRTFVGSAPDGTILSAVSYHVYLRRDVDGRLQRVGFVYSVATREGARRQGHAKQLLQLALAAMEREGCAWSMLFAADQARSLYEQLGWCVYQRTWRHGAFASTQRDLPVRYLVRPVDLAREPDVWQALARVYAAYNVTRPLTLVRDDAHWQNYVLPTLIQWGADQHGAVLVAQDRADRSICGYLVVQLFEAHNGCNLVEVGALPGHALAISALLDAVARSYSAHQAPALIQLPFEPAIDTALDSLFGPTLQHIAAPWGVCMARPLAPDWTHDRIAGLFRATGAISWRIDEFD